MNVKVVGDSKGLQGIRHTLIQWFDEDGENKVELGFEKQLKVGDRFTYDECTYEVEHAEGTQAVVRMTMQKIPDTATTVVHKCPNRKRQIDGMNEEDIINLKKEIGDKTFNQHQKGRVKMNHHNKMSLRCPHCKVIFWKKKNLMPEEVQVEVALGEIEHEDFEGGLEKEDLDRQVEEGTWLK